MQKLCLSVLSLVLSGFAYSAAADLKVVACEPEWGALAQELGGDKVEVFNATTALQDPHHIQARPSLIAKVRNAERPEMSRRSAPSPHRGLGAELGRLHWVMAAASSTT